MEFLEIARRHGQTQIEHPARRASAGMPDVFHRARDLPGPRIRGCTGRRLKDIGIDSRARLFRCPLPDAVQAAMAMTAQGLISVSIWPPCVNMGIGADTHGLQHARVKCVPPRSCDRVAAEGHAQPVTAGEIRHAATVGGARALGRNDIGRLAPVTKADLVSAALDHAGDDADLRSVALLDLYSRRSGGSATGWAAAPRRSHRGHCQGVKVGLRPIHVKLPS